MFQSDPEQYLQSLNIDLENYFSNTIIPQLFIDRDMRLRKFTPPAMKQFTLTAADIGKTVSDLVDSIRFPGLIENIRQVGETRQILEKEIQTIDLRWYQMNILPYIVKETKQVNGVIITFIDITARIADLKELEKLIAEHQLLIDSISHDIKNPLSSIMLAVEILKPSITAVEGAAASIAIIERSAGKIKSMTEELTHLRRDSGVGNGEAELIHIENILEDVTITLAKQIHDAGATIHKTIAVSEILFPRRKLRSVLYNLMSNALKYRSTDRPCVIHIDTRREAEDIIITISDNGMGIAKEKHGSVFMKYYRVTDKVEGTGIGLYLVREIMRTAGGSVELESTPGQGSIFTVHIKVN